MSDTLADLTSWLPSEFLSADTNHHHHKPLFPLNYHRPFPNYDLASSSSTESESDDEDLAAGVTRRFTRSVSLQERIKTPFPLPPPLHPQKRGFSGSPVSTLNGDVYGPFVQSRSSPTTPFVQTDEDAWDLIYAAAGQINMKTSNGNAAVFGNRGVLGPPRPPLAHHQHHPNCEDFLRQQQLRLRFSCGVGRPVGFRQPAWPPVETQRRQQTANGFVVKPVTGGSGGGCGHRTAVVKRECAGTGVFLPRRYPNDPPELKKKASAACLPANHLPARVTFNKNMDPINGQPQPNIHAGFAPHYHPLPPPPTLPHHPKRDALAELVIARRTAVMLAQQRRRSTTEAQEVVLPQEWTY